jgi:two-component system, chemotaxis family, chemotaxis protein CheY
MAKTILLVDDSQTIRTIIKVYLMAHAFEFVEAENGDRALQLSRLVPVELVIADINMPGMDGITFVQHLRADERSKARNVPVILLTGEKSPDLEVRGMKAGANAFIYKPVTSAKLTELVNQMLPRSS